VRLSGNARNKSRLFVCFIFHECYRRVLFRGEATIMFLVTNACLSERREGFPGVILLVNVSLTHLCRRAAEGGWAGKQANLTVMDN